MAKPNIEIKYKQIFINNEFLPAVSGKTFAIINPANKQKIADVAEGDKADVDLAVAAAKKAFARNSEWRKMDPAGRSKLINKLASLMERDLSTLATLESLEVGKPIIDATHEVMGSIAALRNNAEWSDKYFGETLQTPANMVSITRKEPVGVVGQIIPWNVPLLMLTWKWGPALAAGCTIILKPAESTPLGALHVAALVKEAGFPPGVINVVPGYGHTAGAAIAEHMDVNKVAFTGSVGVGKKIMEAAAKSNLKRVTLELGGKSPLVVCEDYDVSKAALICHNGVCWNAGQVCIAPSRVYVHESIHNAFVEKLVEQAKARKVGEAFEPGVQQGPQVNEAIYKRVLNYIDIGVKEGAKLEVGGKPIGTTGYFIQPTVFTNVTDDMVIAKEELFINNEFVPAKSGKTMEVMNPATQKKLADVAEGDQADVDAAVAAARKAFHRNSPWRQLDPAGRAKLIYKLADLIERDVELIAKIETQEAGRLLAETTHSTHSAVEALRHYAAWSDKYFGETFQTAKNLMSMTRKEPVGVVGQIIPWNGPILMLAWKWGPALAAGCTIVLKPAEDTPLGALHVASLVKEAGFPAGVINVVPGYGRTAGHAIASHMDINKVAFTGSLPTGKHIMAAAANSNLKRVTLELGGKSPLVICEDYDMEKAAAIALQGVFFNAGQVCVATSRVFVHESVHDIFLANLVKLARKRRLGNPLEPRVEQGPQINENMFKKVLNYIEIGKKEGAKLEAGGAPAAIGGYFIEPAVFSNVTDDMQIAKEEIFGPVLCVLKYQTMEEVIDRANNSPFGLASAILTNDINKAMAFANNVEAGMVWVNGVAVPVSSAFGGYKQSGIGRELGRYGLESYLETKTVTITLDPVA